MSYFDNTAKYFSETEKNNDNSTNKDNSNLRCVDSIKESFDETLTNYRKTKITRTVKKYTLKLDA